MSAQLSYPDVIEPIIPVWARRKRGGWGGGDENSARTPAVTATSSSSSSSRSSSSRRASSGSKSGGLGAAAIATALVPLVGPSAKILALAGAAEVVRRVWLGGGWRQRRRGGAVARTSAGVGFANALATPREADGVRAEIVAGRLTPALLESAAPLRERQAKPRGRGVDDEVQKGALASTVAHMGRVGDDDILEELKAGVAAVGCVRAAVEALVSSGKSSKQCKALGTALAGAAVREVGLGPEVAPVAGRRVEAVVGLVVERTVDFVERECGDLVEMARGEAPARVLRAVEVGVRVAVADLLAASSAPGKDAPGKASGAARSTARGQQVAQAELEAALEARAGGARGLAECEREAAAVRVAVERGVAVAVGTTALKDKRQVEAAAGEAARRCVALAFARPDEGLARAADEFADVAALAAINALCARQRGSASASEGAPIQADWFAAEEASTRRATEHAQALVAGSAPGTSWDAAVGIAGDAVRAVLGTVAKAELDGSARADQLWLLEAVRGPARERAAQAAADAAGSAPGASGASGPSGGGSLALASGAPLLLASRYFSATYLRAYYEQRGRADALVREQEAASVIQSRFRAHADQKSLQQELAMRDAQAIRARAQRRGEEARIKTVMAVKIQARFRGRAARAKARVLQRQRQQDLDP